MKRAIFLMIFLVLFSVSVSAVCENPYACYKACDHIQPGEAGHTICRDTACEKEYDKYFSCLRNESVWPEKTISDVKGMYDKIWDMIPTFQAKAEECKRLKAATSRASGFNAEMAAAQKEIDCLQDEYNLIVKRNDLYNAAQDARNAALKQQREAASVVDVTGSFDVVGPDGKKKSKVSVGDRIVARSKASIETKQAKIYADPLAEFVVEAIDDFGEVFELKTGRLQAEVKLLLKKRFVIRTPLGHAAVRGTNFSVSYDPVAGEMKVSVFEGSVEMNTTDGSSKLVSAGESMEIDSQGFMEGIDPDSVPVIPDVPVLPDLPDMNTTSVDTGEFIADGAMFYLYITLIVLALAFLISLPVHLVVRKKKETKGYGILSLVYGILSIMFSMFSPVAFGFGICAIFFSFAQRKKSADTMATVGWILGLAGIVLGLLWTVLFIWINMTM